MQHALRAVVFGVLSLGMAVSAIAAPPTDTATLKLFTSDMGELRWHGVGGGKLRTKLCVAASSGRYRLEISSRGGQMTGPGQLPYDIVFRDGTGAEQTASVQNRPMVWFDGHSGTARDCAAGPNAEIEIRLSEANLIQTVAGHYFDQLVVSVSPR